MENVYHQDTSHDISMRATFQITDKQGQTTKKDFTYRRIGSPGDSKTLVFNMDVNPRDDFAP